ncbi:MAG: hypothetical protein A3B47_03870 [Candidatus Levybacteria bacterium RIFCSPLOWO2_01_FULL_39_24]|nr:MAG: hypothetical protein A2800_03675 [Candidatus Levybacteria bacterium RIFCSPHIGHO2_01_FULL_40_16]OGH28184.1 MAG: hypothetical protein A3E12_04385 [Candidatus Levybacteria bacterium RIFCSPHIGHO2_12_FULL_39_9]OGH46373.1 MAG: hypothetical protein A3B47_03870 [Candidatus Levybacteria bacterium RIFCSPLOWO2_01_FULL_39_24]
MKKVCFAPVDDKHYSLAGTPIMINSFKRFHPDIDLVVMRQNVVDKLFPEKGINWYNATPYFAQLLFEDYDLVVKMDVDHVVTGRMMEIFDNVNYDVAGPWNYNDYENSTVENITAEMYIQGGLIASTKKEFWLKWQEMNRDARKYKGRENDVLNLVIYKAMPQLKLKIVDREKDYYGCKSLNRESEFYIENDKLMCRGEQVLAYHNAKGGVYPKLDFENMPFTPEVKEWLKQIGNYGQSIIIR